jgi:predicted Fe-Mo cluster-binding NifX family protein
MLVFPLISGIAIAVTMLVAIPVSDGEVSGPGEAQEILVLDSEKGFAVRERYENPALGAGSSPGIQMIRSLVERNVDALIVGHIGMHAFSYARNRLIVYSSEGMSYEEAVAAYRKGALKRVDDAIPGDHGSHSHMGPHSQ